MYRREKCVQSDNSLKIKTIVFEIHTITGAILENMEIQSSVEKSCSLRSQHAPFLETSNWFEPKLLCSHDTPLLKLDLSGLTV